MNLYELLMTIPAAILTLAIHESVKAVCSTRQGDPMPKRKGFPTWNLFKYIEPIGLILILMFGFGWGQPVPTSPMYYKDRKRGVLITYVTPLAVNWLVGIIAAAALGALYAVLSPLSATRFAGMTWPLTVIRGGLDLLYLFARCNIAIALFNLIPVYPMDGSKILLAFLSPDAAVKLTQNEKILQIILLVLMAFGLVGVLLNPVVDAVVGAFL